VKRRVVILTEIIAPYRIPVFNALARRAEIDLHVLFLAETDPVLRQWQVYRDEIKFSYRILRSYRRRLGRFNVLLTRGTKAALQSVNPEVTICGGYNYLAMWQAQRWALKRDVPFLLWSESNDVDARRRLPWVEAAKRRYIASCHGYVVPGKSAAKYLETFGVVPDKVFVAPNAVDVERFKLGAEQARCDPGLRERLGLPQRYLLYVGRFVRSKGVLDLIAAYATLPEEIRREIGLVLAGDGEARDELARVSRKISPGAVIFPGFLQRDQLPAFYALAEGLVFPTHSDPWGLVVNEAMACGLPVIATEVAGCVADMVREGENGYVVRAAAPEELARAMERLTGVSELQKTMSDCSLQISSRFTPAAWAAGIVDAVAGSMSERPGEDRG
jgi:glycosyltransferase involved in cell wall biosynthesis